MSDLTESEMIEIVKAEIIRLGSQKAYAEKCGVAEQVISDILKGRRALTDKTVAPLRFKRKVVFETADEAEAVRELVK